MVQIQTCQDFLIFKHGTGRDTYSATMTGLQVCLLGFYVLATIPDEMAKLVECKLPVFLVGWFGLLVVGAFRSRNIYGHIRLGVCAHSR